MRGRRFVFAFLLGAVLSTAIGIGSAFIWDHFKGESSSNLSSESAPISEPPPPPPAPLTPAHTPAREVMLQYFAALNQHDFDTAYQFLSPAWGVDRQAYDRYWSQFEVGSIQTEILSITPRSNSSTAITLNWSGIYAGKSVTIQFKCELSETTTSYRIDRCQQKVLRGTAPK